jgi:hypothetical protein
MHASAAVLMHGHTAAGAQLRLQQGCSRVLLALVGAWSVWLWEGLCFVLASAALWLVCAGCCVVSRGDVSFSWVIRSIVPPPRWRASLPLSCWAGVRVFLLWGVVSRFDVGGCALLHVRRRWGARLPT